MNDAHVMVGYSCAGFFSPRNMSYSKGLVLLVLIRRFICFRHEAAKSYDGSKNYLEGIWRIWTSRPPFWWRQKCCAIVVVTITPPPPPPPPLTPSNYRHHNILRVRLLQMLCLFCKRLLVCSSFCWRPAFYFHGMKTNHRRKPAMRLPINNWNSAPNNN